MVFSKIGPVYEPNPLKDPNSFEYKSYHDTCWITDGLTDINRLYVTLCRETNDDVAPISLSEFSFIEEISPVNLSYEPDWSTSRRNFNLTSISKKGYE